MSAALHPTDSDVLYIGGDVEGVFKSTDGGQSWSFVNDNLARGGVMAGVYGVQEIALDPANPDHVWICTWAGLWKSEEGGGNWQLMWPSVMDEELPPVSYICFEPDVPGRIWIGVGDANQMSGGEGRLLLSTDNGGSWVDVATGMDSTAVVHSIFANPLDDPAQRTVLVATDDGIWRSTDSGSTWSRSNAGLPHEDCYRLVATVTEAPPEVILTLSIGTRGDTLVPGSWEGGYYRSLDLGAGWTSVNGDLPRYDYDGDVFYEYWKHQPAMGDSSVIFAGTRVAEAYSDIGLYRTVDGGSTWNRADQNLDYGYLDNIWMYDPNIAVVCQSPADPDRFVAGKDWLALSDDGGTTWQSIYTDRVEEAWRGRGLEATFVYDIEFEPDDPSVIWFGYDDIGLWKSEDGGASFLRMDPSQDFNYECAVSLLRDPASDALYVGRNNGSNDEGDGYPYGVVLKSTDQGQSWSELPLPEGRPLLRRGVDTGGGNSTLFALIYTQGLYRSVDGGATWQQLTSGLEGAGGIGWDLAVDPFNGEHLLLGTNGLGAGGSLYESTDGGDTWSAVPGFPGRVVLAIEFDPLVEDRVYAGTTMDYGWTLPGGGLYTSTDGGTNWTLALDQPRISDIAAHPALEGRLFAVSQQYWNYEPSVDAGVWISEDAGLSWERASDGLGHAAGQFIEVDPHDPDRLWYGSLGGGLWVGSGGSSGVAEGATGRPPAVLRLAQPWPNPFNSSLHLTFELDRPQKVELEVVDLLGRRVARLAHGFHAAGPHRIQWSPGQVSSGTYLLLARTSGGVQMKRATHLK